VGLWIVQECRRFWAEQQQEFDWEVMTHLAASSPPFVSLINPMDPRFLEPGDMPNKVKAFCKETGQAVPRKPGPIIRCVLESLALQFRKSLREIENLTGRKIDRVHLIGDGLSNTLLNHFSANAMQVPVMVGPMQATTVGNLLVQAIATGQVKSLEHARQIVRESFKIETIHPHAQVWNEAYERLERLT
jgi:rhamnulokinase